MTQSSPYGKFLTFPAFSNAGLPVDPFVGCVVANNLLHLCDEASQVRALWIAPGGDALGNDIVTWPVVVGSSWTRGIKLGPFPMTIAEDGLPYPMRVKVACHVTSGTTTVRMVWSAPEQDLSEVYHGDTNVYEFTTATTSPSWVGSDLLTMDAETLRECMHTLETLDDYGGNAITVDVALACVSVFFKDTNATIDGVYAAEYYV